ncbi:hypothetical protein [Campylobacter sputorum]|uniref:hypothetical protein n=1 Tax=Campylobacter sputorum TaxID=206 RepID=UPI00053BEE10|nr:hypothetical protein [Campylobacter sputorum]
MLIQISSEKKEMFNIDVKILDIKQADDKNVMIKVSYLVGSFAENINQSSKDYKIQERTSQLMTKYTFSRTVRYVVKNSTCK